MKALRGGASWGVSRRRGEVGGGAVGGGGQLEEGGQFGKEGLGGTVLPWINLIMMRLQPTSFYIQDPHVVRVFIFPVLVCSKCTTNPCVPNLYQDLHDVINYNIHTISHATCHQSKFAVSSSTVHFHFLLSGSAMIISRIV